ncbi:MAG: hydrogenase nickel incorporation protein HypB [Bacteroidetes bacterium]|jgi:hydrogenase nickel incorporation protein HypB|nr:hydrogenase nickel incorporation protein HypB [Bacteroidota bacterium]
MCGTCGCGEDDHITYRKPGENNLMHSHEHHHGDSSHVHAHDHSHDDHGHQHGHDHAHDHSHTQSISLERNILSKNEQLAERNRGFFEGMKIVALNLVSSPGSGKTSILERSIREFDDQLLCAVIEGDQQTLNDADRIHKAGAPVIQINTGNGCHLDALMVNKAMKQLDLKQNSILFIENVGNLVCPSLFDLGETKRVVIISVTEGDDKPAKYPTMFETAHLCLINKTDLLPYVDFDTARFKETALKVNPHLEFITLSAKTGEGMPEWHNWMRKLKA